MIGVTPWLRVFHRKVPRGTSFSEPHSEPAGQGRWVGPRLASQTAPRADGARRRLD